MLKIKRLLVWHLPEEYKKVLYRVYQKLYDQRLSMLEVHHRAKVDNVYHCTVHKAGSQWFKSVLFDPVIYQYSGLKPWSLRVWGIDSRSYQDRIYVQPFETGRIITPLYLTFEAFNRMPKPDSYKAFFVMRDPRAITVSYYFSARYTHTSMGDVPEKRRILQQMSLKDGLVWTIRYLHSYGLYEALRSWKDAEEKDQNVLAVKLEHLRGLHKRKWFTEILQHCDIQVPNELLDALLRKYSFEEMKKRDHRVVAGISHYRDGAPHGWREYFDSDIKEEFRRCTGDLVEYLGYE